MKKDGFYSSGEFAKMAHITKKTLRYYDAHNILKPSYLTPYGARFYSDEDFILHKLLLEFQRICHKMIVRIIDRHFPDIIK